MLKVNYATTLLIKSIVIYILFCTKLKFKVILLKYEGNKIQIKISFQFPVRPAKVICLHGSIQHTFMIKNVASVALNTFIGTI